MVSKLTFPGIWMGVSPTISIVWPIEQIRRWNFSLFLRMVMRIALLKWEIWASRTMTQWEESKTKEHRSSCDAKGKGSTSFCPRSEVHVVIEPSNESTMTLSGTKSGAYRDTAGASSYKIPLWEYICDPEHYILRWWNFPVGVTLSLRWRTTLSDFEYHQFSISSNVGWLSRMSVSGVPFVHFR